MQKLTCTKCNKLFGHMPLKETSGQENNGIVCSDCWNDWKENQTKLINEHKLDFSLKEHRDFIRDQMKIFLKLSDLK